MSCCINTIAYFGDFGVVKRFLRPSEEEVDSGWDDVAWKWDESDSDMVAYEKKNEESWLQDCFISFSPAADCMVIATTERIVCLTLKWDMHEPGDVKAKFVTQFESILVEETKHEISSVLCLPLASHKRTAQGNPDWTCVIVGFTSGQVRMYTENGVQLFSQIFHEGPVTKIKCQTYEAPRHAKAPEHVEELFIFYPKAVVTIDGFSLIQTLRACRNQVARATASGVEMLVPPPVAYKKWGFQEQEKIVDCENVGVIALNLFDHLQTASLLGGFNCRPRNTMPVAFLFVAAGQYPYLGFYYAIEGSAQPFMSEVVTAVASKLKSVLFSAASGIFGIKSSDDQKPQKQKIEPASPLACRFGLPDARRMGNTLTLSPNKSLALITDTFGRIVLVDTRRGIVVRMWKGYRDAQCGWIEVIEDTHSQDRERVTIVPRIALFIIIYAPRRGLLEVWTAQQGLRIAAFNVSKCARLICPTYGLMGMNSVVQHQKRRFAQCYIVDPEGALKTISVPFHYALGDKNSKRAQSLHLLKKMKISLKENQVFNENEKSELIKILLTIKTPSIRQQALETLVNCNKLDAGFLNLAVEELLQQLSIQDVESLDFESKIILQSCQRLKKLFTFYCEIEKINRESAAPDANSGDSGDSSQALAAIFHFSDEEMNQVLPYLKYEDNLTELKNVSFADDKVLTASKFASFFSVFASHLNKEGNSNIIEISDAISSDDVALLGYFIFHSSLCNCNSLGHLQTLLGNCGLSAEKLMWILIQFWLNQASKCTETLRLINLSVLVKFITSLSNLQMVAVSPNEVSSWWQSSRSMLSQATNIPMAYSAALVCRGVSVMFSACLPESECRDLDPEESEREFPSAEINEGDTRWQWERISMDAIQWNLLTKQLEDLFVLYSLLNYKMAFHECEISPVHVSCNFLIEKGRGIVSELVAKWLIETNLDQKIFNPDSTRNVAVTEVEEAKEALYSINSGNRASEIQELLHSVQKRFPFSLKHDVLCANCAWERVLLWNKLPDDIEHLQEALRLVKLINSAVLKHGAASLIWHMYISKMFTSAALLLEKVGKVPKERLCRRDIGISEIVLTKLLECSAEILDILMDANIASQDQPIPAFEYEDMWQSRQGPVPLVELAVNQRTTNYDLLCHHFQLALAILMLVTFNIKFIRPISLYDTKGKSAFFRDLDSSPQIPTQGIDSAVLNLRKQFLCKVISAVVQSIPEPIPESQQPEDCSIPAVKVEHSSMSHWIGRVMELAKMWDLDVDILRRHHVCELYSSGLDSLAEEILPSVNDRVVLGSQLILLSGQRLYSALKVKYSTVDAIARLSPNMTSWLKTLDQSTLRCLNPPLTMTAVLISNVISHIPEGHAEYQMAIALVDAVHSLMDYSSEVSRKRLTASKDQT